MNDSGHERFAYALALFALGVALLGHGIAATVYADGPTPVTLALPLVGSIVAYRSFVTLLPPESSLSDAGFLGLLGALTTGLVNLAVPAATAAANLGPASVTPPNHWTGLLVGFAGFTTLGVYELLTDRVPGQSGGHALAKSVGAGLVAGAVGVGLLVAPARPAGFLTPVEAMAGLGGALVAVALFDYVKADETTDAIERA
ncbi:hypothetical protein [Halorussus lipolyticus]|uniref:hypothetical protein n=1 Tax=Halorussus lipolyticus TaxID=3034024 RepID=UPI0023E7B387|nr:hypothetical protein [Halorussus sp. DT80]